MGTRDDDTSEAKIVGQRIRSLRLRLGFVRQEDLEERTKVLHAEDPLRYRSILSQAYISNIETGKNLATSDNVRGLLAGAFGISRDQLAEYLLGLLSLDGLVAQRGAKAPPAAKRTPLGPTYGRHEHWDDLVREVREFDPDLRQRTFDVLRDWYCPFPIGQLTAARLAKIATAFQPVIETSGQPSEKRTSR